MEIKPRLTLFVLVHLLVGLAFVFLSAVLSSDRPLSVISYLIALWVGLGSVHFAMLADAAQSVARERKYADRRIAIAEEAHSDVQALFARAKEELAQNHGLIAQWKRDQHRVLRTLGHPAPFPELTDEKRVETKAN